MKLTDVTGIFTGSPWVYAGVFAVGVLISGAATYEVTASFKDNAIKDLQLVAANRDVQDAVGALAQYQNDAATIHLAAAGFTSAEKSLANSMTSISRNFTNAIKDHPLPAGCPDLDAGRLHVLSAAVAAANQARTAGQSAGPAVP